MYTDPYQVLGVSRDASMDDIKKAYRNLSRKYHPDANVGKSSAEQAAAESKFKDIQQAYQQIITEREQRTSYSGYSSNNTTGNNDNSYFQAAANYINNGAFEQALNVLNSMKTRNAQWYYLSAIANAGIGNNIAAMDYAKQAVSMEPTNIQYIQLLNQLQNGGGWYTNMGQNYDSPMAGSDWCYKSLMLTLFCNCCLGGGCCMPYYRF
jgi:molecular chaperone DnaJ